MAEISAETPACGFAPPNFAEGTFSRGSYPNRPVGRLGHQYRTLGQPYGEITSDEPVVCRTKRFQIPLAALARKIYRNVSQSFMEGGKWDGSICRFFLSSLPVSIVEHRANR